MTTATSMPMTAMCLVLALTQAACAFGQDINLERLYDPIEALPANKEVDYIHVSRNRDSIFAGVALVKLNRLDSEWLLDLLRKCEPKKPVQAFNESGCFTIVYINGDRMNIPFYENVLDPESHKLSIQGRQYHCPVSPRIFSAVYLRLVKSYPDARDLDGKRLR